MTTPFRVFIASADKQEDGDVRLTCAVRLVLTAEGQAPAEIAIFPPPGSSTRDGRGPFFYEPEAMVAQLNADVAEGGPIQLDYEHQFDDGQVRTGPVPASGSATAFRYDEERGIVAAVEWTGDAAGLIVSKAYRGFSPTFLARENADGTYTLVKIIGGSLVNRPAFLNLWLAKAAQAPDNGGYTQQEHASTDTDEMNTIREKLGLAQDADEATVLAALTKLLETAARGEALLCRIESADEAAADGVKLIASTRLDAVQLAADTATAELQTARAQLTDASAKLETANAQLAAATAQIEQMQAAETDRTVVACVEAAISGGKVAPAQRDAMLAMARANLDAFQQFVAAAAPLVQPGASVKKPAAAEQQDLGLTEAQLALCKTQNIDPKTYAKQLAAARAMFAQ